MSIFLRDKFKLFKVLFFKIISGNGICSSFNLFTIINYIVCCQKKKKLKNNQKWYYLPCKSSSIKVVFDFKLFAKNSNPFIVKALSKKNK